jgi:predicted secreted protein with PEFG-CTERM motif
MTNPAWAEGNTTQSSLIPMFNPGNIPTNTYNDPAYNFSILPPTGWIPVSQTNKSDSALVVFTNENQNSEANFAIYFNQGRPIPDAVLATPSNQILDLAITNLFGSSKYIVYQKNIQKFSDGFVIQAVVSQNQTTQNQTTQNQTTQNQTTQNQTTQNSPITEEFSFWLKDGRQYFLVMVSSQNGFSQNAADFERSAYTFYVGPQPTVPEFGPIVPVVLALSVISIIIISAKTKLRFSLS